MHSREKLLLRELDTPSGNEIAEIESINEEKSKPDLHLQELINNYRRAAEELSRYLQSTEPEEQKSSVNAMFEVQISGHKKFEENRLVEKKRLQDKEKSKTPASSGKSNIVNRFVSGMFKKKK